MIPLSSAVSNAVESTVKKFGKDGLRSDQLAVTAIDLSRADAVEQASHRGEVQVYPASVVKLFYLAAVHQWLEEKKLEETPEMRRAMSDMIVLSYNEATHYLVDLLTGTTSGPELPEKELNEWYQKRSAVNRYFASLGYKNVVANRKPWCEGPYGREKQSAQVHPPHRNFLCTDDTARLMREIVTGKSVNARRSTEMMKLLERNPLAKEGDPDDQARGFTGLALKPEARLWSKAGWTSQTRHDAAYLELPSGLKLVLVIFTVDHARERQIIPTVAGEIIRVLEENLKK